MTQLKGELLCLSSVVV